MSTAPYVEVSLGMLDYLSDTLSQQCENCSEKDSCDRLLDEDSLEGISCAVYTSILYIQLLQQQKEVHLLEKEVISYG